MSQTTRSFLFGVLCGVISFLALYFSPIQFEAIEYKFLPALLGLLPAWNFVPVEHRQLAPIEKVHGASNGITLFGWSLPFLLVFSLFLF